MPNTIETIRLLRIRAVAEGLDRVERQHEALADAMRDVAKASELAAEAQDKSANKAENGLRGFQGYLRRTDALAKAMQQFERDFKRVTSEVEQKRISPRFAFQEFERMFATLDKLGVSREIALHLDTMDYEKVRDLAKETLATREREAAVQREIAATVEQGNRLKAQNIAASLKEQADEYERLKTKADAYRKTLDPIGEAQRKFAAAVKDIETQKGHGLLSPAMADQAVASERRKLDAVVDSAMAGANGPNRAQEAQTVTAALRAQAQEYERLRTKANEYLQIVDPLVIAERNYAAAVKDIRAAEKAGLFTNPQQVRESLAEAQRQLDMVRRNTGSRANRLNRADAINLSYQLNDILQMGLLGASPAQIAMTQGPQILQIMSSQRGGLGAGIKAVGAELLSLIRPATVVGGLLAGAATGAVVSWNRYNASIREVEQSLLGLGRSTAATAEQLSKIAETGADASGLSVKQSRSVIATLAQTGRIGTEVYGQIRDTVKDYAAITGQNAADATKELAAALADPARGVEELDKKFNLFNATQIKAIQRMAEAGDKAGAQRAILLALVNVISGAAQKTSLLTRAMDALGTVVSNTADAFGKMLSGETLTQRIDREIQSLNKAREALEKTQAAQKSPAASSPLLSPGTLFGGLLRGGLANPPSPVPQPSQAEAIARRQLQLDADFVRQREEIEAQSSRITQARMAQAMQLSKEAKAIYEPMYALDTEIEGLQTHADKLKDALSSGLGEFIPDAELQKMREANDLLQRQIDRREEYRQAGGQGPYEARRQAQFELSVTGMTDYQRGLEEIDRSYRDAVRDARDHLASIEQLTAAERTLAQARDAQKEALKRQNQMATIRSVVPEMFQRFDLQQQRDLFNGDRAGLKAMGFNDRQIDEAIKRLDTALRILKTPVEQMIANYRLEEQAINAVTFEQKAAADAQRAYEEALNRTKDPLQAVTAAQLAYASAVTRAHREVFDLSRQAQREAATAGLRPYQRQQRQIELDYAQRRKDSPNDPYTRETLRYAEAAQKYAAAQEAIRGPLQDATDTIREQVAEARAQAETYGQSVGAITTFAERQRLLNQYLRDGVPITAELRQQVEQYAQAAGQAAEFADSVTRRNQALDDLKSTGKDAFKGLISDLRQGKDAGEAFLNMLNRILDKLLDMALDSLFDGKNIFSLLFGGAGKAPSIPLNLPVGQAPAATFTAPGAANIAAPFAGSMVPNYQGMASAAQAAAQNIGKLGDVSASTVEQYVRFGAALRGMDPDVIARGIRQESGFNPFARNISSRESSYGVMQLNTKGGLGVDAMRAGVDVTNPYAWRQQVDFGLDYMKQHGHGAWYGFRDVGIRDPWAGVNPGNMPDTRSLNTTLGTLNRSFHEMTPNLRSFGTGLESTATSMTHSVPQLTQGLTAMQSTVKSSDIGLGNSFSSVENTITKSGDGLGTAFQQAISKLSSSGGGGGGLGGLFGNLFGGGGGGGGSSYMGFSSSDISIPGWAMNLYHQGGDVGFGGTSRRMTLMDQIAFMSAPRLHGGTLSHDERYAVLQTGEKVLSRDNVRDAMRNGQSMQQQPQVMQPVVNVINPPTQPETRSNPDGSVDIIFEQYDSWQANRAARGRGQTYKAMSMRREGQALRG